MKTGLIIIILIVVILLFMVRGGAKRLVDVDKHQRKQGRPQNQPHDILFTVYVTWYFLIPHSHLFASILEQM